MAINRYKMYNNTTIMEIIRYTTDIKLLNMEEDSKSAEDNKKYMEENII